MTWQCCKKYWLLSAKCVVSCKIRLKLKKTPGFLLAFTKVVSETGTNWLPC